MRCLLDGVAQMALSLCLLTSTALAESPLPDVERLKTSPVLRHLKPNPMPSTTSATRTPGEQTLAQMYLPEGFRAELLASEPDIRLPVAFAFDERGRIWVAEAFSYPTRRTAGQGRDKIVILEDRDGDGRFEARKVFAEGLNLISGLEIGYEREPRAPFILANPPDEFPGFRNYLLASARYDHGAGGAGKPGSDLIYGGHSHVGTMIYLGDNWPANFQGRLFSLRTDHWRTLSLRACL